ALTNVVAMAAPLKSAVEPLMNLLPVKVMVVSGLPAVIELGLMVVRGGGGGAGLDSPMVRVLTLGPPRVTLLLGAPNVNVMVLEASGEPSSIRAPVMFSVVCPVGKVSTPLVTPL